MNLDTWLSLVTLLIHSTVNLVWSVAPTLMTEVLAIAALPHHQSNQKSCMSMSQLLDPWRTLQATQGKANFHELFQIKYKKRKYKTDGREK